MLVASAIESRPVGVQQSRMPRRPSVIRPLEHGVGRIGRGINPEFLAPEVYLERLEDVSIGAGAFGRFANGPAIELALAWRSWGLPEDTPAPAFSVRSDRSTMTQDDIDHGRLVCLIGVAPPRPAEFVTFRIGQRTADLRP